MERVSRARCDRSTSSTLLRHFAQTSTICSIVGDKTPLPPQAESEEADEELFAGDGDELLPDPGLEFEPAVFC